MDSSPNSDTDSDVSKIAAVWEAWNAAVKASDVNRVASLVTDEIVLFPSELAAKQKGNGGLVFWLEALR